MKTAYRLVLSGTAPIHDAGPAFGFSDPATLLTTTIQLHIARIVLRGPKDVSLRDNDYDLLVTLGREEQALLLARLTGDFRGLMTIYSTLKTRGISRLDLLDELVMRLTAQQNWADWPLSRLAHLLAEAERYEDALTLIGKIATDYWNYDHVHLQTATLLSKLGRTDEARAKFTETEEFIRQRVGDERIPPFFGLAEALIQHGETTWAERLLNETYQAITAVKSAALLRKNSLWWYVGDFVDAGRDQQAQALLAKFEPLAASLRGVDKIHAVFGLMAGSLKLGQREIAERYLASLERVARTKQGKHHAEVLIHVCQALFDMGYIDRGLEYAQLLKVAFGDDWGYEIAIQTLVETKQFDQAYILLVHLTDPNSQRRNQNFIALGLAQAGQQAEAEAMYIPSPGLAAHWPSDHNYAQTLIMLAKALPQAGQTDRIQSVLPKVVEAVEQISPGNTNRDRLLSDLAVFLVTCGLLDRAMEIVQKRYFDSPDPENPHEFRVEPIVQALAKHGHFDEALRIIRRYGFWIDTPNDFLERTRADFLLDTAVYLATYGQSARADEVFAEARALLETAEPNYPWRVSNLAGYLLRMKQVEAASQLLDEVTAHHAEASSKTLTSAACRRTKLGQIEQASEFFSLARHQALQTEDARERSDDLLWLAEILFRAGRVEEARGILSDLIQSIQAVRGKHSFLHRARLWLDLAKVLVDAGEVETSWPVLRRIRRMVGNQRTASNHQWRAVPDIVIALAKAGRWDEAESLACVNLEVWNDCRIAESLSVFLRLLIDAGRQHVAQHIVRLLWHDALGRDTRGPQDDTWRAVSLKTLGRGIARSGMIAETMRLIQECGYDRIRQTISLNLAIKLAEMGRFGEALPLLDDIELDEYIQIVCLWVPALEKTEKGLAFSVLREVIRIVGWRRSDWHEIYALLAE